MKGASLLSMLSFERKTSAHLNAPSRKVSSSAPHNPCPHVFLKFRTNVGLEVEVETLSEQRMHNAQNRSPHERQTG